MHRPDEPVVAGGAPQALESHNPEDLAFRARVKPALRASLAAEPLRIAAERYRQLGAATAVSDATIDYDGEALRVLYVAWTPEDARALRDAEAPLLTRRGHPAEDAGSARAMGRLLGYPACCVEHFLATTFRQETSGGHPVRELGAALRRTLPIALRWAPGAPSTAPPRAPRHAEHLGIAPHAQDYLAARVAYTAHPDPLLNHLVMAARAHLISFYPCSYHCPAACEVARATLGALERLRPGAGDALLARLSRPVVLGACDGRAIVDLDTATGLVRAAEAPAAPGRPPLPADQALALRSVGARVDAQGWVHGVARAGEARAFLMDFRRAT